MKARAIYAEWYDEIQMKLDSYGSKKIVESNPGFETFFKISENDKTIITNRHMIIFLFIKSIMPFLILKFT